MILSAWYFHQLSLVIHDSLLNVRFDDRISALDMITYHVDEFVRLDDDWYTDRAYYETSLQFLIENIDREPYTVASFYDENLNRLSIHRDSKETNFDPMQYSDFITAVKENESGRMRLKYSSPNEPTQEFWVYYRWIPTFISPEDRYLIVIGLSHLSLVNYPENWLNGGIAALMIVMTCLNGMLILIVSSKPRCRNKECLGSKVKSWINDSDPKSGVT